MEDAALFFRQRRLAAFHRRRNHQVLSAEWRREVEEARTFQGLCRPTVIARVLDIAEPWAADADEMRQWVEWWKPSYRAARRLSAEQRAYLKQGGWWSPVVAHQIDRQAPAIVVAAARPGLHKQITDEVRS